MDIRSPFDASPLVRLLHIPDHHQHTLRFLKIAICEREIPSSTVQVLSDQLNLTRFPLAQLWIDIPGRQLCNLAVNWGTLTHIWIGRDRIDTWYQFTIEHAYTVLSRCSNLINCHILLPSDARHPIPTFDSQYFTQVITLPHLTDLTIKGAPAPKAFASCLKLPSLQSLKVSQRLSFPPHAPIQNGWPQGESDSVLLEFIRIYGPQLTYLWFDYEGLTQSALVKCLEGVPNVEKLQLLATIHSQSITPAKEYWRSATMNNQLVRRLTPGGGIEGEICLCPKLREFSCILSGADENWWDWVNFLAERRTVGATKGSAVAQLTFAAITNFMWDTRSAVATMKEVLRDEGIDMTGIAIYGNS